MAQMFFKSGVVTVPEGVLELVVSSLAIPFDPLSVQVSIHAPSVDSDLISVYIVGAMTPDGFTVQFSSTIPSEGYVLNWTAWASEIAPSGGDTLALQYSDLFGEVKRFLGYGGASTTLSDSQAEEVDSYVQAGVRQFYYPPAVNGVDVDHEWSFMRPFGQVTTTIDSSTVLMPEGFGRLIGNVEFDPELYIPAAVSCPEGLVRERLASSPEKGAPKLVCSRRIETYGPDGQRCQLLMWPTPDKEYVLSFRQESDSGKLSETGRPFHLGGARFSELVLESCLSIAEQRANDEAGLHTERFNTLLASAVMQDRKFSATFYGPLSTSSLGTDSPSFLGRIPNQRGRFTIHYKGMSW